MFRQEPYIGMPIDLSGPGHERYENENGNGPETGPGYENESRPENKTDGPEARRFIEKERSEETLPLAMAYVPVQRWEKPYDFEKGFDRGTIFPALDQSFPVYGGDMGK